MRREALVRALAGIRSDAGKARIARHLPEDAQPKDFMVQIGLAKPDNDNAAAPVGDDAQAGMCPTCGQPMPESACPACGEPDGDEEALLAGE